jgi:hypothetical protein
MTLYDSGLLQPDGDIEDITVLYAIMAQRYRESQAAVNKPSQDTLPNRE